MKCGRHPFGRIFVFNDDKILSNVYFLDWKGKLRNQFLRNKPRNVRNELFALKGIDIAKYDENPNKIFLGQQNSVDEPKAPDQIQEISLQDKFQTNFLFKHQNTQSQIEPPPYLNLKPPDNSNHHNPNDPNSDNPDNPNSDNPNSGTPDNTNSGNLDNSNSDNSDTGQCIDQNYIETFFPPGDNNDIEWEDTFDNESDDYSTVLKDLPLNEYQF